jgi:Ca2+-binding RTX toxin-like protein
MQSQQQKIAITVENVAPENGVALAPFWVGFHNGDFDSFDVEQEASVAIETLAEDGSPDSLAAEFSDRRFGTIQETLSSPDGFVSGEVIETKITLDSDDVSSRYLSYAAMILPSNDQFIANEDAREHLIFDDNGNFLGAEFTINVDDAWDAGTEVNDEIPENTAFFGQTTPNTGVDENGVVTETPGFLPEGSGGILDDPRFANGDFTAPGYQIANVRIANLIEGTEGQDVLFGTAAPDDIYASQGDDFIYDKNGSDRIFAGAGNDYLDGGEGNNYLVGAKGNDLFNAGSGNDTILAGLGADFISSGTGNDLIYGGAGNDIINAGNGYDNVFVWKGNDRVLLNAGEGAIEIYGFAEGDTFSLGAELSDGDALSLETFGLDTQIYNGDDLLAVVNNVTLNDLAIV